MNVLFALTRKPNVPIQRQNKL